LWPHLGDVATVPSSEGLVKLVVSSLAEAFPDIFDEDVPYSTVGVGLVWVDVGRGS